jgi:parallel beta-helix repeat protein
LVTIQGNYIGTDASGEISLGNHGDGVTTTGRVFAVQGNLISGNALDGLNLRSVSSTNSVVRNYIGTDATGRRPLGNGGDGIDVFDVTGLNVGPQFEVTQPPPAVINPAGVGRNVISANGGHGARFGQTFPISNAWNVRRNFIGTDVTGAAPLGNAGSGIYVTARGFSIGGSNGAVIHEGNVISANRGDGITVDGVAAGLPLGAAVQGNRIGTDVSGGVVLPNAGDGIAIHDSSGVLVGARFPTDRSYGNTIAENGGTGVRVTGSGAGNTLSANRIFSNAGLGIDLGGDGVTPDDPLDADAGPNGLQNIPVIAAAATGRNARTETVVQFSLHAEPNTSHTVEFFASPARDASGYGEGATYLGFATITTDAAGNAAGRVTVDRAEAGAWVTATATSAAGNTSEFSAAVRVAERTAVGRRGSYEDGGGVVPAQASVADVAVADPVTLAVIHGSGARAAGRRRGALD